MQMRETDAHLNSFARRHIGPNREEIDAMLDRVGFENLDALIEAAIPKNIRLDRQLDLPEAKSESEAVTELRAIAKKNKVARSFIGAGYYDCTTPPVIQRNILENPGWYTAYTPYQAELAQGRLEALLNFQTMIVDFTKLDIANASLLDEATAAAEAMALCHAVATARKTFFVADNCHPQTIEVVRTRAKPLGIARVRTTSMVCGWQLSATKKVFRAVATAWQSAIASAAAVASSRSDALAISSLVKSTIIV